MPILFLSFFLTSVSASLNSVDWSFDIKKVNILAPSWSSLGSPGTALRCTVQRSTQLPNPPQLPCTAPDLAALGFRHGSQTMRCTGVRTTDPGSVNSQICWAQTEERGSARPSPGGAQGPITSPVSPTSAQALEVTIHDNKLSTQILSILHMKTKEGFNWVFTHSPQDMNKHCGHQYHLMSWCPCLDQHQP